MDLLHLGLLVYADIYIMYILYVHFRGSRSCVRWPATGHDQSQTSNLPFHVFRTVELFQENPFSRRNSSWFVRRNRSRPHRERRRKFGTFRRLWWLSKIRRFRYPNTGM